MVKVWFTLVGFPLVGFPSVGLHLVGFPLVGNSLFASMNITTGQSPIAGTESIDRDRVWQLGWSPSIGTKARATVKELNQAAFGEGGRPLPTQTF